MRYSSTLLLRAVRLESQLTLKLHVAVRQAARSIDLGIGIWPEVRAYYSDSRLIFLENLISEITTRFDIEPAVSHDSLRSVAERLAVIRPSHMLPIASNMMRHKLLARIDVNRGALLFAISCLRRVVEYLKSDVYPSHPQIKQIRSDLTLCELAFESFMPTLRVVSMAKQIGNFHQSMFKQHKRLRRSRPSQQRGKFP